MVARSRRCEPTQQPEVLPTAGEVFDDGTFLELIREQPGTTHLALLLQRGSTLKIADRHRLGSVTYVPATLSPGLLGHMHFPTRPRKYGSTATLFSALFELLKTTVGLDAREARVASAFVFATHFVDCLPIAPCLAITAAELADAVHFLRVLASLCRHAIPLASLQPADVWKLPSGLCPTLLLSQPVHTRSTLSCLWASQYRGFGVLHGDKIIDSQLAKAMILDEETPQEFLQIPAAQIFLAPARNALPVLDDSALREIAGQFQPKLLAYRFKNHAAVRRCAFDLTQFAGATRQMARTFCACFANDTQLQASVVSALRPQDEAARGARWMRLDSLVAEALLVGCHTPEITSIRVGELTNTVNGILAGRGDGVKVSSRRVGAILRSLNFFSQSR